MLRYEIAAWTVTEWVMAGHVNRVMAGHVKRVMAGQVKRVMAGHVKRVMHISVAQKKRNFYPLCTINHTVTQKFEALHQKPEGCGLDSRRCHWKYSLALTFRPQCISLSSSQPLKEISNTNIPWAGKRG